MFCFAPIFTDNMVLQREMAVAVFGSGTPKEAVVVRVPERDLSAETVVKADGSWRITLPPTCAGSDCTLTAESEGICRTLYHVAFGEVWLAGGQSNMEFMLKDAKGGAEELARCADSNVRYFQVPRNTFVDEAYAQAFAQAHWEMAAPETAGTWSAVAYLAAKELAEKLCVPIGIIGCNYGGSSVSCWMTESDLQAHRAGHAYLEDYQKAIAGKTDAEMIAAYDAYLVYHADWTKKMEACYRTDGNMAWDEIIRRCGENQWPGPMGIKSPYRPAGMYHTMLKPIMPYTIRGVFYYQGENDDHRPDTYGTLLQMMIARWRQDFENDTLPFVLVQLPMFSYVDTPENGAWSKLREAQMRTCRTGKNIGLAVILDCGEFGNIHPTDKRQVGHRVALQAQQLVYGLSEEEAFGPIYAHSFVVGETLTVEFAHAQNGMEFHGVPQDFELAGTDGVYYPAEAVLAGNRLLLTSHAVPKPVTARYAWRNYGAVTLYGMNGIPAAPFRTEPPKMSLVLP